MNDTRILYGAPAAEALAQESAALCAELQRRRVTPCLAIVRVGSRGEDLSYEASLVKHCRAAGVDVRVCEMDEAVSAQTLRDRLEDLSACDSIHGILPMLPLPDGLDAELVRRAIAPEKDVDGVTEASLAALLTGSGRGFAPCTAEAAVRMLEHYRIDLSGKRVAVLGRSAVVGKPAALLLENADATVTLCHSKTRDLAAVCRSADILLCAMGRAGRVGRECMTARQVIIDAGTSVGTDGQLHGDVDAEAAMGLVSALTPVPGGLGAVTTAVLIHHVMRSAAQNQS